MVNLELQDRVGEKTKDGRHVFLDFYDPLIEASLPTLKELAGISGGCQSVTLSRRISSGQVQQIATDGLCADARSSIPSAVSMPASGSREALHGAVITIAMQHVARRT